MASDFFVFQAENRTIGIVKSECVHARACATRDEAALDIFEHIEVAHS